MPLVEPGELFAHLCRPRLQRRLGRGTQCEVVTIGADGTVAIADLRGKATLLLEVGGEIEPPGMPTATTAQGSQCRVGIAARLVNASEYQIRILVCRSSEHTGSEQAEDGRDLGMG
jgi:hypothetical protein